MDDLGRAADWPTPAATTARSPSTVIDVDVAGLRVRRWPGAGRSRPCRSPGRRTSPRRCTALRLVVPITPLGCVIVTVPGKLGSMLPKGSSASTTRENAWPAATVAGGSPADGITNWVAAALVTLMPFVVAQVTEGLVASDGVAGTDRVDRQAAELGHALAGGDGRGAAQRRAARVVGERQCDLAGDGVGLPNWSSPPTSRPKRPRPGRWPAACSMISAATVDCGATEMESVFTGTQVGAGHLQGVSAGRVQYHVCHVRDAAGSRWRSWSR